MQDTLNHFGAQFLNFAWPMLWQSSLLIAVVFVMDLSLKRKLRASVRHALWLVVLVKLLLPPTLALPTSVAWWLFPAKPAPKINIPKNYVVTYSDDLAPPPEFNFQPVPIAAPPPPKLDDAVMLALSHEADIYAPTLLEVAKLAFRRPLMSLGVLGLIGIIESRSALRQRIERLVDFQAPRRAGLTLASLCGIFMFSAVALPMGEGPAPTEKETAPAATASTPPVTTPHTNLPSVIVQAEIYQMPWNDLKNLVSNLHFNPGHGDGDGWWSASPEEFSKLQSDLKKTGFSSLSRPRIQTSSGMQAQFFVGNDPHGTGIDCLPVVNGGQIDLTVKGEVMNNSANSGTTNRFAAKALLQNHAGMVIRVSNDPSNAVVFLNIEILTNNPPPRFQQRLVPITKPQSADGASVLPKSTTIFPVANPYATNKLIFMGAGRQAIMAKLDHVHLDKVSYDGMPLNEVLKQLSGQCRLRDPEHKGINFLINNNPDLSGQPAAASPTAGAGAINGGPLVPGIDPNTGLPMAPTAGTPTTANEPPNVGSYIIKIPSLTDARLGDVLDAIVLVSDHPLKYSIQDFAIVFSAKGPEIPQLFIRTFRIDPNTFYSGLEKVDRKSLGTIQPGTGGQDIHGLGDFDTTNSLQNVNGMAYITTQTPASTPSKLARAFFTSLGVNLLYPPGKSVFFNDKKGLLFVKATESDLDTIERALQALNQVPPQIHIKARFLELPEDALDSFNNFLNSIGRGPVSLTGMLSDPNTRVALRALESRKDVEVLGEPEITVLSGRQTQMRVTQVVETNGPANSQTNQAEVGPILDLVPYVLADGYTINLAAIPTLAETAWRPPLTVATANLWDNQTLVLESHPSLAVNADPHAKKLLIFITATIVDPAGARVHSDDELPFAQNQFPTQPEKATEHDLDSIEQSHVKLNQTNRPQTLINSSLAPRSNVEILGEPEITVLSGRQTRIRATENPINSSLAPRSNLVIQQTIPLFHPTDPIPQFFVGNSVPGPRIYPAFLTDNQRATERQQMSQTLQNQNGLPPQIHIKARFYEEPAGTAADLTKFLNTTNPNDGRPMGILSSAEKKAALQFLQSRAGSVTLAEPEVTMLTGRTSQVRATEYITVITNLAVVHTSFQNSIIPQTNTVEVGSFLDMVPNALADGDVINLYAIPSLKEFLGYKQLPLPQNKASGGTVQLPTVSPAFRTQQLAATVNVWDDQTLVLTGLEEHSALKPAFSPDAFFSTTAAPATNTVQKEVIVFITPTLVDSTGNRIHSDTDLIALPAIPPQPK